MRSFKTLFIIIFILCAFGTNAKSTGIDTYPLEPVELSISSYGEGPLAKIFKIILPYLEKDSAAPIYIRYMPGNGGASALTYLLYGNTRGYTLSSFLLPSFILQPKMPDCMYDSADFKLVSILLKYPVALWVAENSPYQTLDDLINDSRGKPIGSIYIAGLGLYGGHYMAHLQFASLSGVSFQYMPLANTKLSRKAIEDGDAVAAWSAGTLTEALPGMRMLAVASKEPSEVLKNTPTFIQSGLDFHVEEYIGIVVHKDVNEVMEKRIQGFFEEKFNNNLLKEELRKKGITPFYRDNEELSLVIKEENEKIDKFLDMFGIFIQ